MQLKKETKLQWNFAIYHRLTNSLLSKENLQRKNTPKKVTQKGEDASKAGLWQIHQIIFVSSKSDSHLPEKPVLFASIKGL